MKPIAVIDIDGTLANCEHRLHHINGADNSVKNWDAFYAELHLDEPIRPAIDLLRAIQSSYLLLLLTGRPEKYRTETTRWLFKHHIRWDWLFMRPDGDHREDCVVKPELLLKFLDNQHRFPTDVAFVLEDRPSNCRMWRERFGYLTLQLTDKEF